VEPEKVVAKEVESKIKNDHEHVVDEQASEEQRQPLEAEEQHAVEVERVQNADEDVEYDPELQHVMGEALLHCMALVVLLA